jgi:putative oxidoreductase
MSTQNFIEWIVNPKVKWNTFDYVMLLFRIFVAAELIFVHGLKKVGIHSLAVEVVPNPFHLPTLFNQGFAIAANLLFPFFVLVGLLTHLAVIPIVCVTLTGYFVVHGHDSLLMKDIPFMYSVAFLLLFFFGAGKYSADHFIFKSFQR